MERAQIVVGSGPAGVAAAVALLAQGHTVWMLDGGAQLEPANAHQLAQLSKLPPSEWPGPASQWMRTGTKAAVKGLLKLSYGSDFPYRSMPGATPVVGEGVYVQQSMGLGGLSATWGTAIMPYRQADMANWPLTAADLAPHYANVLRFLPVAQGFDGLAPDFPLWKVTAPMPLGPQGRQLWASLQANEPGLHAAGIRFGQSRLAVDAQAERAAIPCQLCGLCMYGCPAGLLYSSAHTVATLLQSPKFRYLPGHVARRIHELPNHVQVDVILHDGTAQTLSGHRVYLAAGVLASTAIVLRSLGAYDRPVHFQDSHYFLLPMLRWRGAPGFERGNLHTMAQIFLEVTDDTISPHTAHLQVYTYNDLFEQPIRARLGPLANLFPWNTVLSRMVLVQGFLHSRDSPGFEGRLVRTAAGDELRLTAGTSATAPSIRELINKLHAVSKMTGMVPVTPMLQQGEPGRGFHTGGTFPMRRTPQGFESDLLGRPAGMLRTHMVDASVLPSIAATTITYTVMANADRIAQAAGAL